MKNTMKLLTAIIAIAITVSVGCKKPKDGATGPQGPAGNANVQNYNITIHPNDWVYDNNYNEWHYNYYITANMNSAVLGYIMSGNGEQPLPYVYTNGNCRYTMATNLFKTPPYVQFQFTNFTTATVAPTYDQYLYLVIMPPAKIKSHPNVNYSNYYEVKRTFNLKD